jgi:hypothetical protein
MGMTIASGKARLNSSHLNRSQKNFIFDFFPSRITSSLTAESIALSVSQSLSSCREACASSNCVPAWELLQDACHSLLTAPRNSARAETLSRLAQNASWESLHSCVDWSSAPVMARELFGGAAAVEGACLVARGAAESALRCVDRALLLVPPSAAGEEGLLQRVASAARAIVIAQSGPLLPLQPTVFDKSAVEAVLAASAKSGTTSCLSGRPPARWSASGLTMSTFLNLLSGDSPVIVTGAVDHWPALLTPATGERDRRWGNFNYLSEMLRARGAPIETGGHYAADAWLEEWSHDLGAFVRDEVARCAADVSGSAPTPSPKYLAQARLFDVIPALRADAPCPDAVEVAAGLSGNVRALAWLGPRGTFSPLHTDAPHNFFVQAVGAKRVRLFAPGERANAVLPRAPLPLGSNTAALPAEALAAQLPVSPTDVSRAQDLLSEWNRAGGEGTEPENTWPALYPAYSRGDIEAWDALLLPGDAMFIPSGWWHSMTSVTASFSVSFWWGPNKDEK